MKIHAILILSILVFVSLSGSFTLIRTSAQSSGWWFQTGAVDQNSFNNYGANATIQTILTIPAGYQSDPTGVGNGYSFWVGEYLTNGAWIQVGYLRHTIQTWYSNGTVTQSTWTEGSWFYEYFTPGEQQTTFTTGQIGPLGSAGVNGSFHTYSMISTGGAWNFYMDNKLLGSVSYSQLGGPSTESSGSNKVIIAAEDAPAGSFSVTCTITTTSGQITICDEMPPVVFEQIYTMSAAGSWMSANYALSYAGLGAPSSPYSGIWPFGIQADPAAESFEVGTGLPITYGGDVLWGTYSVNAISQVSQAATNPVGTGYSKNTYVYGSKVQIYLQDYSLVQDGINYTFAGWQGIGNGSYTGDAQYAGVTVYSDITEVALWKETNTLQANVTSLQDQVAGLQQNNSALSSELQQFRANQTSLQNQLKQVEANQTLLSNQLQQSKSKAQNLTSALQNVESQKAALEQQSSRGFDFEIILAAGFAVSLVALVVLALKKRR